MDDLPRDWMYIPGDVEHYFRNEYDDLTAIQWGKAEDKFGWTVKVD